MTESNDGTSEKTCFSVFSDISRRSVSFLPRRGHAAAPNALLLLLLLLLALLALLLLALSTLFGF